MTRMPKGMRNQLEFDRTTQPTMYCRKGFDNEELEEKIREDLEQDKPDHKGE
jgi:hypothetical protein